MGTRRVRDHGQFGQRPRVYLTTPCPHGPGVVDALKAQRTPAELGRFGVTHIMYAACNCSKSIIDHLAARGARKDVAEHVVLVGQDEQLARRIERAGFQLWRLFARFQRLDVFDNCRVQVSARGHRREHSAAARVVKAHRS